MRSIANYLPNIDFFSFSKWRTLKRSLPWQVMMSAI
jgi:hypothetical protein